MGFKSILGQEMALEQLQKAVANNRISHAYLFVGPSGVGKSLTAKALAKLLNCESLAGSQVCHRCSSCKKNDSGNHPQVHLIESTDASIKIDQIRLLQDKLKYKSFDGEYQVVIIDPVEQITTQAANSLLKILEEPPENIVFILIAQDRAAVMPTILSRCQPIKFQALAPRDIQQILVAQGVAEGQAKIACQLANGSAGLAMELSNDQEIGLLRELTLEMVTLVNNKDSLGLLNLGDQLLQEKVSLAKLFDLLIMWYRDIIVWKETGSEKLLVNRDKLQFIKEETDNVVELLEKIEQISLCRRQLLRNVNESIALESLLMELTR